ncbi:MAG: hypothetical protein H0W30_19900 [Gemmatimonadaceae bacterium]|nr:hypothetical protein [Gemmatimonadaceae bacterium]
MAEHPKPVNYTYDDAARILRHLDFRVSDAEGSHRVWKRKIDEHTTLRVSLVDSGHGKLKSVYVKKMVQILNAHGLVPEETDNAVD